MRLKDKVAIVTGGAHGMGEAEARLFAKEGAAVVIADVLNREGEAVAADISVSQGRARYIRTDVTSEEDWQKLITETISTYGRLDILVNNAGINIRNRPEVYDLADWHKVIATNLTSAMLASKAAHPHLKAGGHGRVINNGSMLSIFGLPFHAAYGASKGGVVQMTKSMAVAWAADGITVNCLLPGWIDTDLTRKARTDMAGLNDNVLARTPKRRWGSPGDFEGVAAFLGSDASAFITGVAIPVDGGFSVNG